MIKKVFKWIFYLFLLIIIAFGTGTYYLLKNKDKITKIVINQLNAHLEIPIHTTEINLSLFKKIPYVVVEFENVWAEDKLNNDTLLALKDVYILLNIHKIIKEEYEINKLVLNDGFLNIYIDAEGKNNYKIWQNTQKDDTKEYQVNLNDIILNNIRLNFINSPNNIHISSHIKSLKINGDFTNNDATLQLKSSLYIYYITKGDIKYVKNGFAILNVIFDKHKQILTYKEGYVKINRQRIETSGIIDFSNGNLNINLNGKNLHFDSDENILNLDSKITSYGRIKGTVYTIVRLSGNFRYKNRLDIYTSFNLSNGSITLNNQNLNYDLSYIKGKFSSKAKTHSDLLEIDSLYATGNSDTIYANFVISEFNAPQLKINSNISLNPEHINPFLPNNNTIIFENGRILAKWETNFVALKDDNLWKQFIGKTKKAFVQTKNITVQFPKKQKTITQLNSAFSLNQSLVIKKFSCFSSDMDISLQGKISSFLNLFDKRKTWIDLRTYSDNIDLFKLLYISSEEKRERLKLPQYIVLKSETFIDNLKIEENNYRNAQLELYHKPGLTTLKLYNSDVFEGNLKGNCALSISEMEGMKLAILAETENVNISELFKAYNEFGQSFITSKNLSGKIDAQVNFRSNLTHDFKIDRTSIISNASVTIKEGELVEHKPMYSLSKYISIDELKHIYFADLTNEIYIKDEYITIPEMNINSSAMDIEISGKHFFDSHFEYQMNIYLSDLLAKKVSHNKDNEGSFTFIQRNNPKHFRIPLIMKGDSTDYDVQINKKQARINFSESIQKEKQEIKKALQEEFKIFDKQPIDDNSASSEMHFQFDEEETNTQSGNQSESKTSTSGKSGLQFEFDE